MRRLVFLILVGLVHSLTISVGVAGDVGTVPMQVKLEREQVNFIEPHYRAYIAAESNRFAFRVPVGYRLAGDPATGTLTLANREGSGSVTFAIWGVVPPGTAALSPDAFRESLLRDNSTATVAQEFWRDNAGGGGPGFDLQWKETGKLVKCKRVVFMSSPAGVLQFTITGGRSNFPTLQNDLDAIILSFQCTTNGAKPKVPPMLDRS